ncbi:jg47 [Pararge aegeria aegeria]|uniref:Jg47 protein n=1 Tax=Pararge aegeria aegeria TaxID=348720 RepID=A0A8S4QSR3_9NEOP|nr:jg47 [Pararge aegeria aegeria]
MTYAALPRSEAFHSRLEVQARAARNERQRGTVGLRVRHLSLSYLSERCVRVDSFYTIHLHVFGKDEGVPSSTVLSRLDPAATCDALNYQHCAYQFGAAIPAPWDPNVHPSELCAPPRRRGGRKTLGASQVAAGFKRHKTVEFGTPYKRCMPSSGRLSVNMMINPYGSPLQSKGLTPTKGSV